MLDLVEETAEDLMVQTNGRGYQLLESNVSSAYFAHQLGFLYSRTCVVPPEQGIKITAKRNMFHIPCKLEIVAEGESVLVRTSVDLPMNMFLLEYTGEIFLLRPDTASSSIRDFKYTQV